MVLAANDMRNAQVDVVDHARQKVEPATVLTPNNRIAEQLGIEALRAANQVVPGDWHIVIEPESPVRRAALRRRSISGLSLVDRWKPAPEQDLPTEFELFRGLVTGIDAPARFEPIELALVKVEPLRLANHL